MYKKTLLGPIIMVLLVALSGCGQSSSVELKDPSKTPGEPIGVVKMLTQDDLLFADLPAGPLMSPDGTKALWMVANYVQGEEMPSWRMSITDLDTLSSSEIASGPGVFTAPPQWAPDGGSLAYVADSEDGTPQLFTISSAGGDPSQITNEPTGVTSFGWRSPEAIVFAESVPGPENEAAQAEGDDTIHVTETTDDAVKMFQVDVTSGDVKPVTSNNDQITYLSVSPDGSKAFVTRTNATNGVDEYYQEIPTLNFLVDLDTGKEQQVLQDVRRLNGAAWSNDSKTLYVQESSTPDELVIATTTTLKALDTATNVERDINLNWERGLHSQIPDPLKATDSGFFSLLADGANPKLARYETAAGDFPKEVLNGDHQGNIFSFDISQDGRKIVYSYSTPSIPPQMYVAEIKGSSITNPRKMTNFNPGWAEKQFTRSETITWEGALGEPVEGILIYPAGYQPDKRYPLMLMIHGGPFHVDLDEWASNTYTIYPYQMVAQKGAFVLAVNYHGSSEYGLEFARSIRDGKYLEYPQQDLENGVQRLVDLGMVDSERLATLGWSNGGVLSHALIADDPRYKAASIGAGANEWVSLWGQSDYGFAVMEYYLGASPIEDPSLYQDPETASFYNAENVKTPVVIYQGTEDRNVPPTSAWIAFRGLQKYGGAPVDLFMFPGEAHDPIMLAHQKRKLSEDMKLFDANFFKSEN